jgi:integrase
MIYKRGKTYWYKFMWKGELIRESTKQGNPRIARQMESAHKTSLAKGEVGIRERKPVPTLAEFNEQRFLPWAKATFEKTSLKSWLWYRVGIRALKRYKPMADSKLNGITGELVADFAAHRQAEGLQVSSINSTLRVLRRILRLAAEWGYLDTVPKIKLLPGERRRERVVSPEEEGKYLAAAPEPLASIATVLANTGMRPEECFRLRWESITWDNGPHGTFLVTHGKTAAARRVLPMAPRVRALLDMRWEGTGRPVDGWVWPAPTHSGHVESSSLKKQHRNALRISGVRPFVLYSLRHTFLTRLGESGCNVWTLARIAGHSSIGISARYVHPSEDAVLNAISQLGGHKIGHSPEKTLPESNDSRVLTH